MNVIGIILYGVCSTYRSMRGLKPTCQSRATSAPESLTSDRSLSSENNSSLSSISQSTSNVKSTSKKSTSKPRRSFSKSSKSTVPPTPKKRHLNKLNQNFIPSTPNLNNNHKSSQNNLTPTQNFNYIQKYSENDNIPTPNLNNNHKSSQNSLPPTQNFNYIHKSSENVITPTPNLNDIDNSSQHSLPPTQNLNYIHNSSENVITPTTNLNYIHKSSQNVLTPTPFQMGSTESIESSPPTTKKTAIPPSTTLYPNADPYYIWEHREKTGKREEIQTYLSTDSFYDFPSALTFLHQFEPFLAKPTCPPSRVTDPLSCYGRDYSQQPLKRKSRDYSQRHEHVKTAIPKKSKTFSKPSTANFFPPRNHYQTETIQKKTNSYAERSQINSRSSVTFTPTKVKQTSPKETGTQSEESESVVKEIQLFTIVHEGKSKKKYSDYVKPTKPENITPLTTQPSDNRSPTKNRFSEFLFPSKEEQFFKNTSHSPLPEIPPNSRFSSLGDTLPPAHTSIKSSSSSPLKLKQNEQGNPTENSSDLPNVPLNLQQTSERSSSLSEIRPPKKSSLSHEGYRERKSSLGSNVRFSIDNSRIDSFSINQKSSVKNLEETIKDYSTDSILQNESNPNKDSETRDSRQSDEQIKSFKSKTLLRPPETLPPKRDRADYFRSYNEAVTKKPQIRLSDVATPEVSCFGMISTDKIIHETKFKAPFKKKKVTSTEQEVRVCEVIKPIPDLMYNPQQEDEKKKKDGEDHSTDSRH
ncbi:general transcriptional corepressor trfA-like isoform X2 [Cimex lectularius]|nr:general transcriptional corepressor trfA-like isoform X2 [Cimex lectularius]